MPELALDHYDRDALVRHLDGVDVAELVRRNALCPGRAPSPPIGESFLTWTYDLRLTQRERHLTAARWHGRSMLGDPD
jgi:hypothetical protein